MIIRKVTPADVGMWVRDHFFPAPYGHVSWYLLHIFFQLGDVDPLGNGKGRSRTQAM
jgi:hypothetical protein